jgi:hypothetical protein
MVTIESDLIRVAESFFNTRQTRHSAVYSHPKAWIKHIKSMVKAFELEHSLDPGSPLTNGRATSVF